MNTSFSLFQKCFDKALSFLIKSINFISLDIFFSYETIFSAYYIAI